MSAGRNERTAEVIRLFESGDLHRTALESRTLLEFVTRLGMTPDSYRWGLRNARKQGVQIPTFDELRIIARHIVPANDGCRDMPVPGRGEPEPGRVACPRCGRPDLTPDGLPVHVQSCMSALDEDFADEEPTRPETGHPPIEAPKIGLHTSTVQHSVPLQPLGPAPAGRSTLVRPDGSIVLQWVKEKPGDRYDELIEAIRRLGDEMPKYEPIGAMPHGSDELLCVYPMGDPHLGMLAWAPEAGDNFDAEIAERHLFGAADRLVSLAPAASHALLLNLGDFFHADGMTNTTTAGTRVDVDSRWPKVLAAGVRLMRRLIDRALEKHRYVTVINCIGNHDSHSSIMLSIALQQFYERESRVYVNTSPEAFHWYRFGKCLIGAHHGNRVKRDDLGAVMACDRPKDWGETEHRHFYIGHVHHDTLKELRGVVVESMRTLAAQDAWHRGQGYRAGRDMKLDIFHRDHGRINRHIVGVSWFKGAQ